jgi:hypothetical protein
MTAGPRVRETNRRLRWIVAATAAFGIATLAVAFLLGRGEAPAAEGPTVGERLATLKAQRASLQARADGQTRIGLLEDFRVASLLSDALAARHESDFETPVERLPAPQRQAFADIDALNIALSDALARPGEGARLAAHAVTARARASLERLAGTDNAPLILLFTPRFVPPRRATGELTLAPQAPPAPLSPSAPPGSAQQGVLRLEPVPKSTAVTAATPVVPTVPRYAPAFASASADDPPVAIEVTGLHMASDGGVPPVLTIGAWRGEATLAPERLRFSVPRRAFTTETGHAIFATASLAIRRASRTSTFDLLLVVLPDRPGSFAIDQRVRTLVPEANTLVSPEILVRGGVGEARTVRRCFDPPVGWRFDKTRRRVVIVERLGWLDDVSDATVNSGTVEFANDEGPDQICVVVTTRAVTRAARTATIGRFEATLLRDRAEDSVAQSGVRALDWHEAIRVPIDPGVVEWKLYVRLFDEIDREFAGGPEGSATLTGVPFLHIVLDGKAKVLVLQADLAAEP